MHPFASEPGLLSLVLLDNFFRSSQQVKEEEAAQQAAGQAGAYVLDPLLKYLAKNFVSARDLDLKLLGMFRAFDVEGRSMLSYQDMALGVHRASPMATNLLSEEEYFKMTENLGMCQSDGTLDLQGFKTVMLKQLRWYLQRRSAEAALYMQAPAEIESLLLNTKFLMVETHLMTEALLNAPVPHPSESMPPGASWRSGGASRWRAPASTNHMQRAASLDADLLFSNSIKGGEIFLSESSGIETRERRLHGTPDSNGSGLPTVCDAVNGEADITGEEVRAHDELGCAQHTKHHPQLSGLRRVDRGADTSHKAPCQCCVVVRDSFTAGERVGDAS